jgi:hypothetical protein
VGAGPSFSRAACVWLAAALAVPTACAGRSTSLDTENAAGEASGGVGNPRGGAGGSSGSNTTGAGATGGVGAAGSGATGAGATGATGMGAAGPGAAGTGGTAGTASCEPAARDCLVDTDCMLATRTPCCGLERVYGVSRVGMCVLPELPCFADCDGPRWLTDSNETTTDLAVVKVRCDLVESDSGVCTSYVDLNAAPPPTYCNGELCASTEVCVHGSVAGGPAPRCEPPAEDGTCPAGYKLSDCPETGQMGCLEERVAPPPECVDAGMTCGVSVDCSCLPDDICGPLASQCSGVMDRHVNCVDLSP